MKKIITSIIGLGIMLPIIVSAATFEISPNKTSYEAGENIVLNISVNPENSIIYTAMFNANFSTSTIEVVSFSINDKMLPLKQSGYDVVNNSNGTFIKTGGYTSGIKTNTPFGTLVLRAKGEGFGELVIFKTSKLLDSNNVNRQVGDKIVLFEIKPKSTNVKISSSGISPVVITASTTGESTTTVNILNDKKTDSKNNLWSYLIALVLIVIVGGILYFVNNRKEIE